MILPDPSQFVRIEISGKKTWGGGYEAPYTVVGMVPVRKPDPNFEDCFYEDYEEVIIEQGFANHQIAEAWKKKYVEEYVSQTYFTTAVAFERLDSNTQKG